MAINFRKGNELDELFDSFAKLPEVTFPDDKKKSKKNKTTSSDSKK